MNLASLRRLALPVLAALWLSPAACAQPVSVESPAPVSPVVLDEAARARLMTDVTWLADDARGGRPAGSAEGKAVREWLAARLAETGARPFGARYDRPFTLSDGGDGGNVMGWVAGTSESDRVIVVTAHFDHLGVRAGNIYNGADDNASGVAGLLAAATWFASHAPAHSVVFAALDAEENGMQGARALLADPPVPLDRVALNINLDMIGRNSAGELYASGTRQTPSLRPLLERVADASPVVLKFGHDDPATGMQDWTYQSDQGVFYRAGIPFVYFGVEDHPDYHRPTDDIEGIQPEFLSGTAQTIISSISVLDGALDSVVPDGGSSQ